MTSLNGSANNPGVMAVSECMAVVILDLLNGLLPKSCTLH